MDNGLIVKWSNWIFIYLETALMEVCLMEIVLIGKWSNLEDACRDAR